MDKIDMHEAIDHDRRRFFGAAALSFTAAELGVIGASHAETKPAQLPAIKAGTNTSFAPPVCSMSVMPRPGRRTAPRVPASRLALRHP
jgi:hypothetical protein